MEETIFTKIVKGEIPCYKIAEDDRFFAFLDISPLAKGHTLVITKLQNDYIFDFVRKFLELDKPVLMRASEVKKKEEKK